MRYEIRNRPDFASLHVHFEPGEQLVTEAGAMMAMSADLKMESNLQGGLLAAARRKLAGESLVLNTYTATAPGQTLVLAPPSPGDLMAMSLAGDTVFVQSGCFHAATTGVEMSSKWGGAKGFFSGAGLFLVKAWGRGDLFVSSYGAVERVDVDGSYVLDTSHIVAFDATLEYSIKTGGAKSLLFSGEGLVCHFKGRGRLWYQTRSAGALAAFLNPFRPTKGSS